MAHGGGGYGTMPTHALEEPARAEVSELDRAPCQGPGQGEGEGEGEGEGQGEDVRVGMRVRVRVGMSESG